VIQFSTFVDQGGLFSYIAPEARVPVTHPLRKIREIVRDVLPPAEAVGPEALACVAQTQLLT
jgi:hypothetical protein